MSSAKTLVDWWTELLDQAVAGQPSDEAKREFLEYAFRKSEQRYVDFSDGKLADNPHPIYGRPHAADFVAFIGIVTARRDAMREAA